ncbi:MAG: hypothetical protein R2719_01640 [Micropruina sp.]
MAAIHDLSGQTYVAAYGTSVKMAKTEAEAAGADPAASGREHPAP